MDELYDLHKQGHAESRELERLQVALNVAHRSYSSSQKEIREYQEKIENWREFKRGYEAEKGRQCREDVEAAFRSEFDLVAGVDDVAPPAIELARQRVVSSVEPPSLKRKNPVPENPPEEVAQPPRKKQCKRRTQDHCDRPDWKCTICGYISKNHHVHRHLRSKTLPLHDLQDIALHDAHMIEVRGVMPVRAPRVRTRSVRTVGRT